MDEENVNDFTQSAIPTTGAPSLSQSIMPGLYSGIEKITQGQSNLAKREADKKKSVSGISENFEPEIVWDLEQEELDLYAKDWSDKLTTQAMQKDVDVDDLTYGPLANQVRDGKRDLTRLTKKSQENQTGYQKVSNQLQEQRGLKDKAKFDTDAMEDWLNRFKNAKTIEERNKMINNPDDSPYVPAYSEWDLATATKPLFSTDPATGMRYMDEEIWANRIKTYITGQDGEGYYNKHKQAGESPETFSARMAQKFGEDTQLVPDQNRYKPAPKPRSGSASSTKAQGKTITNPISFEGQTIDPVDVGTDYEYNTIEFKSTGKKDLVNAKGKTISGTPRGVILGKDGKKYIEVILEDKGVAYVPYEQGGNELLVLKETGAKDDAALNAMFKGNAKGKSSTSKSTTTTKKTAAEAMREAQGKN